MSMGGGAQLPSGDRPARSFAHDDCKKIGYFYTEKRSIRICKNWNTCGRSYGQKLVVYMASMIVSVTQTLKSFVFPFLLAEYLMIYVYASHLRTPARHSSNAD